MALKVTQEGDMLSVTRVRDDKKLSLYTDFRSLIANAVKGSKPGRKIEVLVLDLM